MEPLTLFDKIWDSHIVKSIEGGPDVLYIDQHYIHEVTSPQAFDGLRQRGLRVSRAFTLKKLECSKQADCLNNRAWNNGIGPRFYFVGFRNSR